MLVMKYNYSITESVYFLNVPDYYCILRWFKSQWQIMPYDRLSYIPVKILLDLYLIHFKFIYCLMLAIEWFVAFPINISWILLMKAADLSSVSMFTGSTLESKLGYILPGWVFILSFSFHPLCWASLSSCMAYLP